MRRKGVTFAELLVALAVLALISCGSMIFLQMNLMWYRRQLLAVRAAFLGQDLLESFPVASGSRNGKLEEFEYSLDVQAEARGAWLHLSFTQGKYVLLKQSLWRPSQPRILSFQPFQSEEWKEVEADGPGQLNPVSSLDEFVTQGNTLVWKGKELLQNPGGVEQPQASPDGKQVAFLSVAGSELWVFDRMHHRAECWQRSLQVIDPPCWLDSKSVLVCQDAQRLLRVRRNSTPEVLYEGARLSAPTLSPYSSRVAFVGTGDSTNDIFVMTLSTREVINITKSPDGEIRPLWSRQGDRILFALAPVAGGSALWCVNPDGTGRQDLQIVAQGNRWNWISP